MEGPKESQYGESSQPNTGMFLSDIRRLRILSSRLVTGLFAGTYRSAFRGHGVEFAELREYLPGDDIRHIDWNVTARTGVPFSKCFIEERELTVMLLLDRSASLDTPTPRKPKSAVAAELCAILAQAAVRNNDRVGLITFTGQVENVLPPGKGGRHIERLIDLAVSPALAKGSSGMTAALACLQRITLRSAIVFLISDFITDGFAPALAAATGRHDVVAVCISDQLDCELPDIGLLPVRAAEDSHSRLIDSSSELVRQRYREAAVARQSAIEQMVTAAGAGLLQLHTARDPLTDLHRFFLVRQQRYRD